MFPWIRSLRYNYFFSTVDLRRLIFSLFDRQQAFGMVYDDTNACNDAKQLD